MKWRAAGLCVMAWALMGSAAAQAPARPATSACPEPADIEPAHLYGLWQIRLWPEGGDGASPHARGVLRFERHPEFPGSVRGELRRTAAGQDVSARVSGDVIDGVFHLDESADGLSISAVWTGEPEDCGRSIRGIRRPAEGQPAGEPVLQFRLQRQPGW